MPLSTAKFANLSDSGFSSSIVPNFLQCFDHGCGGKELWQSEDSFDAVRDAAEVYLNSPNIFLSFHQLKSEIFGDQIAGLDGSKCVRLDKTIPTSTANLWRMLSGTIRIELLFVPETHLKRRTA